MKLTAKEQKLAEKLYTWLSRNQVRASLSQNQATFSRGGKSTTVRSKRRTTRESVVRLR